MLPPRHVRGVGRVKQDVKEMHSAHGLSEGINSQFEVYFRPSCARLSSSTRAHSTQSTGTYSVPVNKFFYIENATAEVALGDRLRGMPGTLAKIRRHLRVDHAIASNG